MILSLIPSLLLRCIVQNVKLHIDSFHILYSHFYTYSTFTITVVWEKFTVGYFRVKIVYGKIFSSLRVSDENFLTMKYFKVKLQFCSVAQELNA